MISPTSRLHRTMKGVKNFDMELSDSALREFGFSSLLLEGERVLGIYRGKTKNSTFVVTDRALIALIKNVPTRLVEYEKMKSSLVIEVNEKPETSEIQITLNNEDIVKILVDGGDGKFRDVFSFGRFISRVIEDQSV